MTAHLVTLGPDSGSEARPVVEVDADSPEHAAELAVAQLPDHHVVGNPEPK